MDGYPGEHPVVPEPPQMSSEVALRNLFLIYPSYSAGYFSGISLCVYLTFCRPSHRALPGILYQGHQYVRPWLYFIRHFPGVRTRASKSSDSRQDPHSALWQDIASPTLGDRESERPESLKGGGDQQIPGRRNTTTWRKSGHCGLRIRNGYPSAEPVGDLVSTGPPDHQWIRQVGL